MTAPVSLNSVLNAATNRVSPPEETTDELSGIRAGETSVFIGSAKMTPRAPLDTIYTADEAAERLRLSNRAIIKLGRQYGLCSRFGRDYLFSEADLLALWEVMREPAKASRFASANAPSSDHRLYERLVKLTAKKKRSGMKTKP